jgi:hypothetical protein
VEKGKRIYAKRVKDYVHLREFIKGNRLSSKLTSGS